MHYHFGYDGSGNMTQNSRVSADYLGYDASQPHAVSSVRATEGSISPSRCEVGYNSRNRPAYITEEDWKLDIAHGSGFRFHRGFTGHEHYDEFGVINVNARLYDPVIGRFFSPAPQV
jgi:hypothetical protein